MPRRAEYKRRWRAHCTHRYRISFWAKSLTGMDLNVGGQIVHVGPEWQSVVVVTGQSPTIRPAIGGTVNVWGPAIVRWP